MSEKLEVLEDIKSKIHAIRGQQVMLDRELAKFYGVSTKALNQAVKRNKERFPENFCFQLSILEKEELVTNCDHLSELKFSCVLPRAFTEQGVSVLSAVLKSIAEQEADKINFELPEDISFYSAVISHSYYAIIN